MVCCVEQAWFWNIIAVLKKNVNTYVVSFLEASLKIRSDRVKNVVLYYYINLNTLHAGKSP